MNIPQGSENDSSAPWNETRQKKTYDAHYILVAAGLFSGNWYRVWLPDCLGVGELTVLSACWCIDNGKEYIDDTAARPKGAIFCDTDEYYE
jgi:hypothetical protein